MTGRNYAAAAGGGRGAAPRGRGAARGGVADGRVEPVGARGGGGRGGPAGRGAPTNRGPAAGRGRGASTNRGQGNPRGNSVPRAGATNTRGSERDAAFARSRAVQLDPRMDLVEPGKAVAVDVEGVQLGRQNGDRRQGLGRISIVNEASEVVFDTFASYYPSADAYPNPKKLALGVNWSDIHPKNGAQGLAHVLNVAREIFDKAGIVVTHNAKAETQFVRGLQQDAWVKVNKEGKTEQMHAINIPGIDLTKYALRDTQKLPEYRTYAKQNGGDPSLKILAAEFLSEDLQTDHHCSVEDARATMKLYMLRKDEIEKLAAAEKAAADAKAAEEKDEVDARAGDAEAQKRVDARAQRKRLEGLTPTQQRECLQCEDIQKNIEIHGPNGAVWVGPKKTGTLLLGQEAKDYLNNFSIWREKRTPIFGSNCLWDWRNNFW